MIGIILGSLSAIMMLGLLCLLLGFAWPRTWLLSGPAPWIQRLVFGYCVLNVLFTFFYRNDLPIVTAWVLLGALCIWSFTRCVWLAGERIKLPPLKSDIIFWVLALLPGICIIFYPLLHSQAIFFGNLDPPDLSGFTASFIKDGHGWNDLQVIFKEAAGNARWWEPTNDHWKLPDYRAAAALDTFLFLLRWGHAILVVQISMLFHQPIWFGVLVAAAFPFLLCPLIIMDACKSRGVPASLALALTVSASGTAGVILWDEGLFTHIAATPILMLMTLHFVSFFTENAHIGQKLSLALLLSALLIIWSEGIPIMGGMAIALVIIGFVIPQKMAVPARKVLAGMVLVGCMCIAIEPQFVMEFVMNTIDRLRHGFSPGILNRDWSLIGIFLPFPYVSIHGKEMPNLHLLFSFHLLERLIEAVCLFAAGAMLIFRNQKGGLEISIIALTILAFTAINQTYTFWIVATIVQPALTMHIYFALPGRIITIERRYIAFAYAACTILTMQLLQHDYGVAAKPMYLTQFETDFSLVEPGKRFAYLTPSIANNYQRLAWSGELYWANRRRGWVDRTVTYQTKEEMGLPLFLYFDCDIEGRARCDAITAASGGRLHEKKVYPTEISVGTLLDSRGVVDKAKLDALILQEFGVPSQGNEAPPY